MPQNRHTVRSSFTIRPERGEQFRKDNVKFLMYCGMYHAMSPISPVDVADDCSLELIWCPDLQAVRSKSASRHFLSFAPQLQDRMW